MKKSEVLQAWGRILAGRAPSLSIEITKECPLRCPGCYAFDAAHLGGGVGLRELSDFRGEALVNGVLRLIDENRPVHVSLVGGDPLVRYRELEQLLPEMEKRSVHTQVVTSAFREIPSAWKGIKRLNVVVSVDGLQPEHDARRKPATYERILKNIARARVTIHCTITAQIASRPQYLEKFLEFWTAQPQVAKVWFSLFTPQRDAADAEILTEAERATVITELNRLRIMFPKLEMPEKLVKELMRPPASPADCIFARTTEIISADLETRITPCQFGGEPDCSRCGCVASMALAAVGHHRVAGPLTAGHLFRASEHLGKAWRRMVGRTGQGRSRRGPVPLFPIVGQREPDGRKV
ncbi:radical SAM protein [Acidobacteria bacterium AB60]|nr:radical SAM protein [Acidobacteria bacterium AB60]